MTDKTMKPDQMAGKLEEAIDIDGLHSKIDMDIEDEIGKGARPTEVVWDEKIGDLMNYLFLLDGMMKEEG